MAEADAPDLEALLRQQESLRQIIESIGSELELRPLLTSIVQRACELLAADRGTIGLLDEERRVIRTEAMFNMPPDELGAEMPPGVGLAGQVLLTRQPVILNHYGEVPHPTQPHILEDTVIGLPIFWHEHLLGFFGIGAAPPRRFGQPDVERLALFARHAAIAIHNARLYETEKRRAARSATLNRISQLISSSLSLDEILQRAVEAINEHLHYSSVALLLVDPEDAQTLVLRARSGVYAERVAGEYRQSIAHGIVGAAAAARQPLLIPDVWSDGRYIPVPGAPQINSELAMPLLIGERLLGVLNIEAERRIPEEDATGLARIADQLAVAIEHASLYEEEKRRSERVALIARVGQLIAARLDPDELYTTTAEQLHGRLGYDHVSLFLLDPADPGMLVQRARASRWPRPTPGAYRTSIGVGVVGTAAQQRAPEVVNDLAHSPRYIPVPGASALRAELAVPIMLGEQLLGVLDVAMTRRFSPEDVTAVQIVADQLAVAIAHGQLFAETQARLEETRLLYETGQRISTALAVDDVVDAYIEQVAVHQRYACSVALYDFDESGARTAVVVRGRWSPSQGLVRGPERYPYSYDALDPLLDAGETVTIADVRHDARVSAELREIQRQSRRPALAFIPLMVRGQRIGLVVLSYNKVHQWADEDLRPYQTTAAQLATAIDSRQQQQLVLERSQQVAVLEERQRLARELHDSVTQLIFSITLIAQSIAPAWRRSQTEGEQRVHRLLQLSQSALAEMRALLAELRPPEPAALPPDAAAAAAADHTLPGNLRVRQYGLVAALRKHLADVAQDGPQTGLDAGGYLRLPPAHEEALYRIAQEALNNAVKHARAHHVHVRLTTEGRATRLLVSDDGAGFVLEAVGALPAGAAHSRAPEKGGMGLRTMRERAEALGGTLQITAAPGRGTTVAVTIPRQEEHST